MASISTEREERDAETVSIVISFVLSPEDPAPSVVVLRACVFRPSYSCSGVRYLLQLK
jgi:hypothetical protein